MWILIILVIILFIIVSSYYYETFSLNTKEHVITITDSGIGNLLSCFIYKVLNCFRQDVNLPIKLIFTKNIKVGSKEEVFLEKLKKCQFLSLNTFDKQKLITTLPKDFFHNNSTARSLWHLESDTKIIFWEIIKPYLNNILTECLEPFTNTVENLPIIHFRCADVPFVKHKCYHLPYYSFYDWCLKKMKLWCQKKKIIPYSNIYIMTCHNWKNKGHRKYCQIYLNDLQQYLLNTHQIYSKILSCRDIIDDMKTLFQAPVVISATSSFVFMSAYSSPGLYLRGREMYKNLDTTPKIPWIYPEKPLEHKYIKDYKNTQIVISQLRKYYPLTISTGYWNIPSKHSNNLVSFKHSLKLNVPMVIYGDKQFLQLAKKIRQYIISPTKFIYLPFSKLKSIVEEFFFLNHSFHSNQYLKRDPLHCPSWQVIMIWLSKILLVENTININPFGSDYFGWYNPGYSEFRYKDPPPFIWPNDDSFYQNKTRVWISNIQQTRHHFHPFQSKFQDGCPIGSLFLGYKHPIKRFIEKTKVIISDGLKGGFGKTICSEQDLFQEVYLEEPNLFIDMITSNKSGKRLNGSSSPYHTWFW